jgi:CheY-like chemotaxis protein
MNRMNLSPTLRPSAPAGSPHPASANPFAGHEIATGVPLASTDVSARVPLRPSTWFGHILIVDDDRALRCIMNKMLSFAGYQIDCAGDGEAGWAALCAGSFDLLITDHDMPRLSGLDLARRARAQSGNLPIILASGNLPREAPDFTRLLTPGAAIEKPFSLTELLTKVRSVLPFAASSAQKSAGSPASQNFARGPSSRYSPAAA